MKFTRAKYLMRLAYIYQKASVSIQKYMKGYVVSKRLRPERSVIILNVMTSTIEEMKLKHALDL